MAECDEEGLEEGGGGDRAEAEVEAVHETGDDVDDGDEDGEDDGVAACTFIVALHLNYGLISK